MNFQLEFIPSGEAAKYSRSPYFLPIQAIDKFEADRIAYELSIMLGAVTDGRLFNTDIYTRYNDSGELKEEFSFCVVEV